MNHNLSNLRIYANKHNIPIISKNTELFLENYVIDNNIQHIIEIGSAIGYSTSCLINAVHQQYHHTGSVISWEISYPHYYQALQHTEEKYGVSIYLWNFCLYPLEKILKYWHYDMVFIDGRKSETLMYLRLLAPYLQTTTRIIVDDVIKFKSKMIDFYNFLDSNKIPYEINPLDSDDGILIIPQSQHLIQALSSL